MKFLQNSKVVGSSLETKKSFLLNKGLTSAEIEVAFSRMDSVSVPHVSSSAGQSSQIIIPHNSFSSRLRDFLNILLLIGGFSYGVRYLWRVSSKLHNSMDACLLRCFHLEIYPRMAFWTNQEGGKESSRDSYGDLQCPFVHSRFFQKLNGCIWVKHWQVLRQFWPGHPTTEAGL